MDRLRKFSTLILLLGCPCVAFGFEPVPGTFHQINQPSNHHPEIQQAATGLQEGWQPFEGGVLPVTEVQQISTFQLVKQKSNDFTEDELDEHALRIAANCSNVFPETEPKKGGVVIDLDDSFYLIPITISSLPPFPANGGKDGVHGVDVDKNCVRDDIEHYLFKTHPGKENEQLRRRLYKYAIWLNFFLIDGISEKTVQAVARKSMQTGMCIDNTISPQAAKSARDGLFENMHNTDPRIQKYFDNMNVVSGFTIQGELQPSC